MGYKRVYSRLNVELSTQAKLILNSGFGNTIKNWKFMGRLFPNQISKISGFLKLIEISKTF
jgi:hypothetical protein